MERTLFKALVNQCELNNANWNNPDSRIMTEYAIAVIRETYGQIGLITCIDRAGDGTIINVEMYKDGELIEVNQTLWDGR